MVFIFLCFEKRSRQTDQRLGFSWREKKIFQFTCDNLLARDLLILFSHLYAEIRGGRSDLTIHVNAEHDAHCGNNLFCSAECSNR